MRIGFLVVLLLGAPFAVASGSAFGTDPAGDEAGFVDPGIPGTRTGVDACKAASADIRAWHFAHARDAVEATLIVGDPGAPVACGGAPLPTVAKARGVQFRAVGTPSIHAMSVGEWEVRDQPGFSTRAARCAILHFSDGEFAYVDGWSCAYREGVAGESWAVPALGRATLWSDGTTRAYDLRSVGFEDVYALACSSTSWVQVCDEAR